MKVSLKEVTNSDSDEMLLSSLARWCKRSVFPHWSKSYVTLSTIFGLVGFCHNAVYHLGDDEEASDPRFRFYCSVPLPPSFVSICSAIVQDFELHHPHCGAVHDSAHELCGKL